MTEKWSLIIEKYKKAKEYLWDNKPDSAYRKNQEKGMIYLYEAYHDALKEPYKEHLPYAGILFMMYEQHRRKYNEELLFHAFLSEAYNECLLSKKENEELERSEMEQIESAYKRSKQFVEMHGIRQDQYRKFKEIIGGKTIPDDFDFHGSRIISFQHDAKNALLKISDGNTAITLKFADVYGITADISPAVTWISHIVCCKYPDSQTIIFDIGFYKISCSDIEVVDVGVDIKAD